MIIEHFFLGDVPPGEVSLVIFATIGVGMAQIVSLFIFICVLMRQDKRKQDDDE